jgi:hypothetical protein
MGRRACVGFLLFHEQKCHEQNYREQEYVQFWLGFDPKTIARAGDALFAAKS